MKQLILTTICFSWGLVSCVHNPSSSGKENNGDFFKNQENNYHTRIIDTDYNAYRSRLLKQLRNQEKLANRQARPVIINGVPVVQWETMAKSPAEIHLQKMIDGMPESCKKQLASSIIHSQDWAHLVITGGMIRYMNQYKDASRLINRLIFSEIRKKGYPCREAKELLEFCATSEDISPLWIFNFTIDWYIKGHPHDRAGWIFLESFMLYEEDESPFFSRICSFVLEKNLDRYSEGKKLVEFYRLGILEYEKKLPFMIKSQGDKSLLPER